MPKPEHLRDIKANARFHEGNNELHRRLFFAVSAALLPPMLIAPICGMNFRHIPELSWDIGYPFAPLVMVLSVTVLL